MGSATLLLVLAASASRPDAIDQAVQRAMREARVPGVQVAVARRGRIVKLGAYGLAHVEDGARVTDDTRFEIASISKMFIATAVRLLADEGKVDLDAPLSRYLEGLPTSWQGYRVRHLLGMSTGLPEDWDLLPWADVRSEYDDASMLVELGRLQPSFPLGTRFQYCSPGYAVLGMLVNRLAGRPFPRFVAERLLGPAGMSESGYNSPDAVVQHRAEGYRMETASGPLLRGFYVAPYMHARADVGMFSTARDLARWVIALDGGAVIRDPDRLFVSFRTDDGQQELGYAYGWVTGLKSGHRAMAHSGGFRTGFSARLIRFPDDGVTLAVTTNCVSCQRVVTEAVLKVVLPDLLDLAAPTGKDPDPEGTARLVGAMEAVARGERASLVGEDVPLAQLDGLRRDILGKQIRFVSRHALASRKLRWHGHSIVDVVTLEIGGAKPRLLVACYRDADGVVHELEPVDG